MFSHRHSAKCFSCEDIWTVIKFQVLGRAAPEIHAEMVRALGLMCPSCADSVLSLGHWVNVFKGGEPGVADAARCGRPVWHGHPRW